MKNKKYHTVEIHL